MLVAEENDATMRTLVETLGRDGYRILRARSGEEIVTIARSARPDLILMDVMMSLLDGYAAARALKRDPGTRDIPIIAFQAPPEGKRRGRRGVRRGRELRPRDERLLLGQIREALELTREKQGVRA